MANVAIGHLPDPFFTVVVTPGGASAPAAVQRGVLYRVVALAATAGIAASAAFINFGAPATADSGVPLPAGVVDYFVFGMADSQGTNLAVNVFAAAGTKVYFTPVCAVPTY